MGWGSSFSKAFKGGLKGALSITGDVFKTTYQTEAIGKIGTKTQRELGRLGGLLSPEFPEPEFPEYEEGKPLVDDEAARALALKRRSLERARMGRSSLRIDLPVRNPGLASSIGSGLRIP